MTTLKKLFRLAFAGLVLVASASVFASAIPLTVTPTTSTDGKFTLSWSGGGSYIEVWPVGASVPSDTLYVSTDWVISGKPSGQYSYYIKNCTPRQSGYDCAASNIVTVTVIIAMSAPRSLTSSDGFTSYDGSYSLSWAAPAEGVVDYYRWSDNNGASWNNAGMALASPVFNRTNGVYRHQVQACNNTTGCGPSAYQDVTVDIDKAPAIYPSTLVSSNGIYTLGWGNAHITGIDYSHVWVYEDGTPYLVYGEYRIPGEVPSQPHSVYISAYSFTKETQGTHAYYVKACRNVIIGGRGEPQPDTGICQNSNSIQITTDFPAPASVTPTFSGTEGVWDTDGNFSLSWPAVTYAISYNIRYGKAGFAKTAPIAVATSFIPPANLADGAWEFEINACNKVSECSTTLVSQGVKRKPSAPLNFNSSDGTTSYNGTYNLSWNPPATGSVTYYQWRENGGIWNNARLDLASAMISHTSGNFLYDIQACNEAGCSGSVSHGVAIMPVLPPAGITAVMDQATGITALKWGPVINVSSYRVQTLLSGQPLDNPITVNSLNTTLPVVKTPGVYSYRVEACRVVGGVQKCATGTSNSVIPQQPNTPEIIAPLDSSGSFEVNWSPSIGATTYELFENFVPIQKKAGDLSKTFGMPTAKPNGTYIYQVRACKVVCSPLSNMVTVVVQQPGPPAVPTKPVVSKLNNIWRISWTGVPGATHYLLNEVNAGQTKLLNVTSNVYLPTPNGTAIYKYKVKACNEFACSDFSAELGTYLSTSSSSSSAGSTATSSGATSSAGTNPSNIVDTTQPTVTLTDGNVVEDFPGTLPDNTAIVGTTGAQFRVDESGAATYNVPIAVPAGVAGVQPQLALTYSSNAGNGIAGQGWSLSGLSAITRCRQTLGQDGRAMPITFSADDRFCLNGQRLMVVSGVYGAPDSTYRTEVDSYVEVTAKGGSTGYPNYFTVEAKDGSISYFGYSPDSKVAGSSNNVGATLLSWNINRFQDSVGNSIDYNYAGAPNDRQLASINYAFPSTNTGTTEQRGDAKASVIFAYEARRDTSSAYVAGYNFLQSQRLSSITLTSDSAQVRKFNLGYMPDTTVNTRYKNNISKLQSIQECRDGACLRPLTFTWGGGNTIAYGGVSETVSYAQIPQNQYLISNLFPDLNGDGKQDFVYLMFEKSTPASGLPNKAEMSVHIKYAGNDTEQVFRVTTDDYAKVQLASLDYNADGRQDLVVNDGKEWHIYMSQPQTSGKWAISVNSFVDPALTNTEANFMDYNGDGLVDMVTSKGFTPLVVDTTKAVTSSLRYKFGSAVQFTLDEADFPAVKNDRPTTATGCTRDTPAWKIRPGTAADFNGDGVTDFVLDYTTYWYNCTGLSTSYRNTYTYAVVARDGRLLNYSQLGTGYNTIHIADLNGDGLSDIINEGNTNEFSYQLNTGSGFGSAINWVTLPSGGGSYPYRAKPQFIDYNGDGATDMVWYDYSDRKSVMARFWGDTTDTVITDQVYAGNTDSVLLMDINGDAIPDRIMVSSAQLVVYLGAMKNGTETVAVNKQATGIVSINNGMDNLTNISYGTLSNSGRYTTLDATPTVNGTKVLCNVDDPRCSPHINYTADSSQFYSYLNSGWSLPVGSVLLQPDKTFGTANASKGAPVLEVNGSMRIVTTVESSSPTAAENSAGQINTSAMARIDYYYGEAKMQALGRGFLGFNTLKTVMIPYGSVPDDGITTINTYRQDFPFNGSPLSTVVYSNNRTDNTATLLSMAKTTWGALSDPATGVYRPYVAGSEENSYSANNGALLQTVTTSTIMDTGNNGISGNVASVSVVTTGSGATSTKSTVNTYSTDEWEKRKGRLIRAEVTTDGVSGGKRTSSFSYYGATDGALRGLLKTETIEPDNADATLTTTYSYDGFGNKKTAAVTGKNAAGAQETRTTTNAYDSDGRYLTMTLNALGQSAAITSRNTLGQPVVSSDINGLDTQVLYDPLGNEYLRTSSNGAWVRTDTRYCGSGDCPAGASYYTRKQVSGGGISIGYFDLLGRSLRTATIGFNGKYVYVDTEYDNQSRIKRQSTPYFADASPAGWTVYRYDALGRVVEVIDPAGKSTTSSYAGLTTTIKNPLGKTVQETRNGLGQLQQVTDHTGNTVTYAYTPKGDLQSAITRSVEGKTAQVLMCYDNLGRKIGMMDEDKGGFKAAIKTCDGFTPVTPPAGWWSYRYDAFGELVKQTDPKGQTTTMGYDSIGRMITRLDKLGNGFVDANTAWFYDVALGNPVPAVPAQGTPAASTPSTGKLTAVIMSDNSSALTSSSCGGGLNHCTLYTYDSQARLSDTTVFLPNETTGFITGTRFDSIGRPYQQYDGLNGVLGVSGVQTHYNQYGYAFQTVNLQDSTLLSRTLDMNARGQVTGELRGNGLVTTNTYDPKTGLLLNQLTNTGVATGSDVQNNTYSWDDVGNLNSRTSAGKLAGAAGSRSLTENFYYDDLNRLERNEIAGAPASHNCAGKDVTYDGLGNITCKGSLTGYKYGGNSSTLAGPHAVIEATLANTNGTTSKFTYSYDANGNQTSDGASVNPRVLEYTSYDLVRKMSKAGLSSEFSYGPDRMRWKRKDVKGFTTTTTYLGNLERIQVNNSSTVEWRRYVGGAIFSYKMDTSMRLLAGTDSYDRRYVYTDHLGSLDVITSSCGTTASNYGTLTNRVSYDAWGSRRTGNTWGAFTDSQQRIAEISIVSYGGVSFNQPVTTRGFTGHEMADDFGIINMNGRIYDPLLGRFLQADPFIQAATNTQSYNRYSYTLNNPLNATDPSGFSWNLLNPGRALIRGAVKIFGAQLVNIVGTAISTYYGGAYGAAAWNYEYSKAMGASNSAAFTSAIVAFISANVFQAIGDKFSNMSSANLSAGTSGLHNFGDNYLTSGQIAGQIFSHAIAGGVLAVFQGGDFGSGFIAAGVTKAFTNLQLKIAGNVGTPGGLVSGTVTAAVIGGTVSEMSGGKFANGANTAAFQFLFNAATSELTIRDKKLIANFRGLVEAQIDRDGNAEVLLKADVLTVTLTKEGWSAELRGIRMVDKFGEGMKELGYSQLGTTVTLSNFSTNGFDANITIPDKFFGIPSPFPKEIYSSHMDPITSLTNAITNNGMIGDSLQKLRDYNQKLQDI